MQKAESMDLKHSDTLDSVADGYIPNSKSTDLIKPSKLDQPPSGENAKSFTGNASSFKNFPKQLSKEMGKNIFLSVREIYVLADFTREMFREKLPKLFQKNLTKFRWSFFLF